MQGLPGSVDTGAARTESLAAPAAKKPKKRHDKSQQDKVLQQLHDSPAFCILVEHQQRLDDLISQRRAAIREALAKPDRLRSRVRITITHVLHPAEGGEPPSWSLLIHGRTLDNADAGSASIPPGQTAANMVLAQQINAAADALIQRGASEADVGRMRMQLALQTGGPQALAALAAGSAPAAAPATKHPLTSYLRRVEVKLLPPTAPAAPAPAVGGAGAMDADGPGAQAAEGTGPEGSDGARVLVWDRSLHLGAHKDCIEVRLQGVGAFEAGARASVTLTLDGQPERYLLPAPLDSLLGVPMETKPRVMQLLGMYIRKERLMDVEQMVTLKGQLAEALGVTSLSYQQLQAEVLKRLQPVPPLHVDHLITPPGRAPVSAASQATVFDVECETLGPINPATEKQAAGLFESLNPDKELEPVEGEMATALKRLAEHRRRRAMLMGLAQSPVDFTASILATQARELRIVKGTSVVPIAQHLQAAQPGRSHLQLEPTIALAAATVAKEFEVQRYTELFKGKWVEDAAVAYLSKAGQVANVFNAAFGGR